MKLFFLISLLSLSLLMAHAASGDINAILLQGPSNYQMAVLLREKPVITFSGDDLVITTHLNSFSIPSSSVTKFTYIAAEDGSGINNMSHSGLTISFDANRLTMANLVPSSDVYVYTTDGILIASASTDSKGGVSFFLPEVQGAVYVVKTSTLTLKIRRS